MRNPNRLFPQARPRLPGIVVAALAAGVAVALLFVTPLRLSSQQISANRFAFVTVTDPMNRFVTGLHQEHFEINENGNKRLITRFLSVDTPMSVAIVSETPLPGAKLNGPEDEMFQTRSVSDAVRHLTASNNPRKAMLLAIPGYDQAILGGIQTFNVDASNLLKGLIEVRNRYVIGFASADSSATIEVIVKQPRGLPLLKPNWK